MLHIGIDATAIPLNRAGAGNYIFNLVRSLANIDAANRYTIFAKQEHIDEWKIVRPNFQFIPSASRSRPLRFLWEQTLLPILVRKYKIDVLHSPHYTMPLVTLCHSVVTFCDMIFFLYPEVHSRIKQAFFQSMMRLSAQRSTALVTISRSTANDLIRVFRVRPEKINTILLAVDETYRPIKDLTTVTQICQKYGLVKGRYILYVGMLEPRKNIPVLLQAYRKLVDRGAQEQLVIAGGRGWLFKEIFATLQSLGLKDKVVFTGYVPDNELPYLYNGARVFVYPSVYEGFGLPVLEAMACGTPVVTSNISSMPEIVEDAGFLVNPYDVDQLAEVIERLLNDDSLHCLMQAQGLKRAALFSWEKTALATLNVYLSVAAHKS